MKRSRSVELFLVVSAAAAMTGCSSERERCVDGNNNIVEDRNCQGPTTGVYHWYYGGSSSGGAVGSHVSGGSTTPGAGDADSATSHGVIGGAGEAHGAGGEGQGGGGGE